MTTEPEPYRLTEHQKVQREEIRFQRQANGHRYLTWNRFTRLVKPDQTCRARDAWTAMPAPT
jgi:hypothetical protein